METIQPDPLLGSIRLLFEVGTVAGMSDGQLLDRFLARREYGTEAAEIAFAALVDRHGPMVLKVCRSRLGDEHDAQDAFQATFLILARKAGSIRNHESAASWLNGVARRVAACARRAAAVRRAKERKAAGRRPESSTVSPSDAYRADLIPAVREEVGDLPEKYRTPLMLCLLDGLTHEEAATRLGWPVGTVKTRVRRAKDQLRTRLGRRGLAPSLGAIGAALTASEASAMPLALVRTTTRAAIRLAAGRALTPAVISTSVATLMELGLGSLSMSRWKMAAMVLTSVGVFSVGAAGFARQGPGNQDPVEPIKARERVKEPTIPRKIERPPATAEEERPDVDAVKLDVESLGLEVNDLKNEMTNLLQYRSQSRSNLRSLTNPQIPGFGGGASGGPPTGEALERAKKFVEDQLDQIEISLRKVREEFLAKTHELNREQQRLKDLEKPAALKEIQAARVAPAGSSPDSNGAGDAERFEKIEATTLDIDLLRIEVDVLKRNVTEALYSRINSQGTLDLLMGSPAPERNMPHMTGQTREDAKKQTVEKLESAEDSLRKARARYLSKSLDLKRKEQQLRDLAKGLPSPIQAEAPHAETDSKATVESKPAADVERRLSDLEQKLDRILKAVESR